MSSVRTINKPMPVLNKSFTSKQNGLSNRMSYNATLFWNHKCRVLNEELYAQRLQKLIYLYLFADCFMKISLHSLEQNNNRMSNTNNIYIFFVSIHTFIISITFEACKSSHEKCYSRLQCSTLSKIRARSGDQ